MPACREYNIRRHEIASTNPPSPTFSIVDPDKVGILVRSDKSTTNYSWFSLCLDMALSIILIGGGARPPFSFSIMRRLTVPIQRLDWYNRPNRR
jgi:hypothetical protein